MKSGGIVVLLLGLLSQGRAAPLLKCDTLLNPISITNQQMLGRWLYIGGSSDLPGSRSLGHLLNSIWLDVRATSLSNVLTILQTQRIYNECSSMIYNVTMENSTMLIEHPFYLKEVYLPTDCTDCLVVYEQVKSSHDSFTSLMLFSRQQMVSSSDVEMLRMQAKCLQMSSPLIMDPNYELCPDNLPATDGLAALNSLLEAKMGQRGSNGFYYPCICKHNLQIKLTILLTEQLQIQGRNQFLGVWTYAAESTNLPGSKALTEMFVDNVWGKIYPANESDSFYVFQVQKMSGRCYSVTSKLTLINNILHMEEPIFATEVLLATSCPDCLVLLSNYTLGGSMYRGLQILTKRPKVTQDEMDEFERQAACLNLPSPTSLDSDKGFCTDDSASKDSETTDLTSVLSQTQPEYMKLLDKLLSSQSGMKTLVHLIANIPTQN